MRNIEGAVELIKSFEGILDGDPRTVNLDPYLCPAGYWTIGWGHAILDPHGKQIKGAENKQLVQAVYPKGLTMIEAEILLADDVRRFSVGVEKLLRVSIPDNKFCALVSFTFNVGMSAFKNSTLLKCVNNGKFDMVPEQFMRWTKSAGKELSGLKRRRLAECKLWNGHW